MIAQLQGTWTRDEPPSKGVRASERTTVPDREGLHLEEPAARKRHRACATGQERAARKRCGKVVDPLGVTHWRDCSPNGSLTSEVHQLAVELRGRRLAFTPEATVADGRGRSSSSTGLRRQITLLLCHRKLVDTEQLGHRREGVDRKLVCTEHRINSTSDPPLHVSRLKQLAHELEAGACKSIALPLHSTAIHEPLRIEQAGRLVRQRQDGELSCNWFWRRRRRRILHHRPCCQDWFLLLLRHALSV